jgi:hypothetical protein
MGGDEGAITGFTLSYKPPTVQCSHLAVALTGLVVDKGLALGMTENGLQSRLRPAMLRRDHGSLVLDVTGTRDTRLRPDTSRSDLSTSYGLKASFGKRGLQRLYVWQVTST